MLVLLIHQALSGATCLGGTVTTYQRMSAKLLVMSAMLGGLIGILTHL